MMNIDEKLLIQAGKQNCNEILNKIYTGNFLDLKFKSIYEPDFNDKIKGRRIPNFLTLITPSGDEYVVPTFQTTDHVRWASFMLDIYIIYNSKNTNFLFYLASLFNTENNVRRIMKEQGLFTKNLFIISKNVNVLYSDHAQSHFVSNVSLFYVYK